MLISDEESIAQEGLDVKHYPFKWKEAKVMAERNQRTDSNHYLPYWERVRLLYLELGGEFIDKYRE
jgi:hypothetical protein